MKKNKRSNSENSESNYWVTDDSGIVISVKQWVEYYGEKEVKHQSSIGSKEKFLPKASSLFAEISKSSGGFIPQSPRIICEDCGKRYPVHKFNAHIIREHAELYSSCVKHENNKNPKNPTEDAKGKRSVLRSIKKCELCDKPVLREHFEYHVVISHYSIYLEITNQNKGDPIKCKYCGDPIKPISLKRHLKRVHHIVIELDESEDIDFPDNFPVSGQEGNIAEAFRQAFKETRDGGREFMKREASGMFGSLPLYDNYDDEASGE